MQLLFEEFALLSSRAALSLWGRSCRTPLLCEGKSPLWLRPAGTSIQGCATKLFARLDDN
jgi:hypothetical protein